MESVERQTVEIPTSPQNVEPALDNDALKAIGLDLEALKQTLELQETTDISERITDKIVTATHFETEELSNLKELVKQIFLVDLTACATITEAWVKGLDNIILCADLKDFDYEERNKGRFELGLTDLIPDTALSLKIKSNGEQKVLFIGYADSRQAYEVLTGYVGAMKHAKLYREKNGELTLVKTTDLNGLRVHI